MSFASAFKDKVTAAAAAAPGLAAKALESGKAAASKAADIANVAKNAVDLMKKKDMSAKEALQEAIAEYKFGPQESDLGGRRRKTRRRSTKRKSRKH